MLTNSIQMMNMQMMMSMQGKMSGRDSYFAHILI